MGEKSQIKQHTQRIAELEADLERAYQLIQQQQQKIVQLQEQIVPNQNQYQQQSTLLPPDNSLRAENSNASTSAGKTHYQSKKKILIRKKQTGQLSRIQFLSIVTGVVLIITLIGLALNRRQNPLPSKPVTTPSVNIPQTTNTLSPLPVSPSVTVEGSPPTFLPQVRQENLELIYNVATPPNFQKSQKLQAIVDDIVSLAADKKFPTKPLSITLINVKTGEYAAYQQEKPRFPASVVKIFWMVYLYAQINNGIGQEADYMPYLDAMIKKSDNNAASYIVDAITQTKSGQNLEGKDYEEWLTKRKKVNKFFQRVGYKKINISQKTFPITQEKIYQPQGYDLKMRGEPKNPIRNKITTQQAARLLYEIYDGQAISSNYSQRMTNLLSIDPATRIEKKNQQNPDEFNPVRGYFSQSLPTDVDFGGKAGWTSGSRQEAAYISTPDGKTAYILVVFAEDRAYAYDWNIFPQISSLVFEHMTNRE